MYSQLLDAVRAALLGPCPVKTLNYIRALRDGKIPRPSGVPPVDTGADISVDIVCTHLFPPAWVKFP